MRDSSAHEQFPLLWALGQSTSCHLAGIRDESYEGKAVNNALVGKVLKDRKVDEWGRKYPIYKIGPFTRGPFTC